MKALFKFIITSLLTLKAKHYLKKNRVQVIAVTGSIGKTTTKEAIFHILKDKFKVSKSPQGFNTELGISLAILHEEKSGFSSIAKWLKILIRALFNPKPKVQKIILEMGADKPGDIKKLVKIAKPTIGIVTNVNPVHMQSGQFKDLDEIRKEKNNLVRKMMKEDVAILNYDDPLVRSMETGGQKLSFGTTKDLDLYATNIEAHNKYIKFKVHFKHQAKLFQVPILGAFQVYTLLPAIATGLKLGIDLEECAETLKDFKMPVSRMNPIDGINDSTIIDSSYNASPTSMNRALELLNDLTAKRKIAALGTMNELGEVKNEAHLNLGKSVSKVADILIAVGPEAATLKEGALEAGMDDKNIYTFFDAEDAGHFLQKTIQAGDLILTKGSQNKVRMERMVKLIMKHPENASKLLCRQEKAWETI